MLDASGVICWSTWQPLFGGSGNTAIPAGPGLYRVRTVGEGEVVYLGQTGRSLRKRVGMLRGCYSEEMPYRDPHTAAPTLWCIRDRDAAEFEVSTALVDVSKVERLALEAVAITLHRLECGRSPVANFGGCIPGYRISSGNNKALAARSKRFRGGREPFAGASPSAPVPGPLEGDVTATNWIGLAWTNWVPLQIAEAGRDVGLYRIKRSGVAGLSYVGQGRIASRFRAHQAKKSVAGHRQAGLLADDLEVSWVPLGADRRVLLELENDAIASHWLNLGAPPEAQFLG
jgi:hypothetical protein